MSEVIRFPSKKPSKIKKTVNVMDVETIGFLTKDDRDIFIVNKEDIKKIMRFIISEKIALVEDEDGK